MVAASRVPAALPAHMVAISPQRWTLVVAIADGVAGDMEVGEGHGLAGLTWRVCALATPLRQLAHKLIDEMN